MRFQPQWSEQAPLHLSRPPSQIELDPPVLRLTLKRVANGEWRLFGDGQSVGRGKLRPNVATCLGSYLGMIIEPEQDRSSSWLQNGCLTGEAAPTLKMGNHPEIERSVQNCGSMPSTAGAAIRHRTSPLAVVLRLTFDLEEHHLHVLEKVYQMEGGFSSIFLADSSVLRRLITFGAETCQLFASFTSCREACVGQRVRCNAYYQRC